MTQRERAIDFMRWIIDNYCIAGIDTFYLPDTDEEINGNELYTRYLKQILQ